MVAGKLLSRVELGIIFSVQYDQLEQYVPRYLVYCLVWAFSGDAKMKCRHGMGDFIRGVTTIPLPSPSSPVLDYEVRLLE